MNSIPQDSGNTPPAPKPIKGSVPNPETSEAAALWADCPYLRPSDHAAWLRHFINVEINLTRLQAGWVPATGKLEWKLWVPGIFFEDMQHARRLRERLEEMPRPKTGVTDTEAGLAGFFAAIAPAGHAATFFRVLHAVVKPALAAAYEAYAGKCDDILDAPILYTLRGIMAEKRRQRGEAEAFFENMAFPAADETAADYQRHVETCLAALGTLTPEYRRGGVMPVTPVARPAGPSPAKTVHDPDLWLAEPDRFPSDRKENPFASTLQEIIYHNATEWQVVGPMCYVLHDAPAMPFEFYVDFSRHIWDECRHSLMGLRRLRELGFKREDFRFPNGGDKPVSPEDYMAALTLVGEACSFGRKRGSIIPFLRQRDFRSAMLPEVDCNDERLHVAYGHQWVPELYLRSRGDQRSLKQISDDVRRAFVGSLEKLKTASEEERRAILANLPTLCSTIEFAHLNFEANAGPVAGDPPVEERSKGVAT